MSIFFDEEGAFDGGELVFPELGLAMIKYHLLDAVFFCGAELYHHVAPFAPHNNHKNLMRRCSMVLYAARQ